MITATPKLAIAIPDFGHQLTQKSRWSVTICFSLQEQSVLQLAECTS